MAFAIGMENLPLPEPISATMSPGLSRSFSMTSFTFTIPSRPVHRLDVLFRRKLLQLKSEGPGEAQSCYPEKHHQQV